MEEPLVVLAVGDVSIGENVADKLALAAPVLKSADIAFCQLEKILTERINPAWTWEVALQPREYARAMANAGFTHISTAGNHHMNGGPDAFVDSLNMLKENNIQPVGVGMNLDEARRPVIVERKGTRVAFLGYSSVIPRCEVPWEARPRRPGCNPMFIHTYYDQTDFHPGTIPRVITFAEKQNLADMQEDMRRAKAEADVVIMTIHWGLHHITTDIATYEHEVAHAAIDAGADLILGTGPHLLKGIQVYKGKVIFHSLANFGSSRAPSHPSHDQPGVRGYWEEMRHDATPPRSHEEKALSIFAKCVISGKQIEKVSFLPCYISEEGRPEALSREDRRSDEVIQYQKWVGEQAGFDTQFSDEGDEVLVLTSSGG